MFVAGLSLLSTACDNNEEWTAVDGAKPELALERTLLASRVGDTFHIRGNVRDADGLAAVKLKCPTLYLDKTIDLLEIYGEPPVEYELDYKITTDAAEAADMFVISVTVVDVLGNETSASVTADMDGDMDAPLFAVAPDDEITVILKEDAALELSFTITDDRGLASVDVAVEALGYVRHVTEFDNPLRFDFAETLALPAVSADYTVEISATDTWDNTSARTCVVHVSDTPDFDRMWLADVSTPEELNSDVMGVPMLVDKVAPFRYEARYYNEKAGTEVYFLPQRTDFKPVCYGLTAPGATSVTGNPGEASPIVLDTPGVYYIITLDLLKKQIETSTYSVGEALDPVPHAFGSTQLDIYEDGSEFGEFWFGYTTSGPGDIMRFTQDSANPHLYRLDSPLTLKAGRHSGFIIHNSHPEGWWNYCTWRADNEQDPERACWYGNYTNPAWTGTKGEDYWFKPSIPADGNYMLTFDAHLGHLRIVPEK